MPTSRRKLKVKVIGCGGIGLCLLNVLGRYLNYQKVPSELVLIDGDDYEEGNRTRQGFHRSGNKAEATADRMTREFTKLVCRGVADYLNEANIKMQIREGDIVFCCVDNHATRKLVSDRCENLKNVVLISGGNNYTDGDIQIHVREKGENVTPPITKTNRIIANPIDRIPVAPALMGCARLQPSEPQLLITNNLVSALMLNAFYGWQEGVFADKDKKYSTVYGDIVVNKVNPIKRS